MEVEVEGKEGGRIKITGEKRKERKEKSVRTSQEKSTNTSMTNQRLTGRHAFSLCRRSRERWLFV